jgi:hypothetical protein
MIVRGIDNLDYHAPGGLASVWAGFKQEASDPDNINTSTVYHFGFSEATGSVRSFVYRSTNDWRSEQLDYGLGLKPECTIPDNFRFPEDIRTMMDEQRAIQRSRPDSQRVYIGGQIQVHCLSQDGYAVWTLGRFDDYDADELGIYENFRARQESGSSKHAKP